ncbi:DUF6458 family protein [Knoellia subterranea]|uniref:DUF6458 domain-containing protein n=1 Tax=Knoellia subterranea KCTC 19937 TaxID=1385521 RepID=A0A0A0JJC4_9MICO|nr:DUF6458 family protein [Knoellia subterranea]KGN37193.1 hypothetical protein N803_15170 [Knoellia subterranea KCTC 19937]
MYIGLGIVLIVLGAILKFVLQVDIPGMDDGALGWILIAAGVLAILLSFAMRGRTRPTGYTSTRSSQVDPATGTRVEETRIDPDSRY